MMNMWDFLLFISSIITFSDSFSPHRRPCVSYRSQKTHLNALTPIGPFCPFRTNAASQLDSKFDEAKPDESILKVFAQIQSGDTPDASALQKAANTLNKAVDTTESLFTRLRISQDFQTREYFAIIDARFAMYDMKREDMVAALKWQAGCLESLAKGTPPPIPPSKVDLERLMNVDQNKIPSVTSMSREAGISELPFEESVFREESVREEYLSLVGDHRKLLEFGSTFASFDPLGKIAFLDEVERIEERWDVFFARGKLMGVLREEYVEQTDTLLNDMRMTEEEFREMLKTSHNAMREQAERERDQVYKL